MNESTAGDAERDLRSFVTTYAMSPHYDEALLRLAKLELLVAIASGIKDSRAGATRPRLDAHGALVSTADAQLADGDTTSAVRIFARVTQRPRQTPVSRID